MTKYAAQKVIADIAGNYPDKMMCYTVELDGNSHLCLRCASKYTLDKWYSDDPIIDISKYYHPTYDDCTVKLMCDDCNMDFQYYDTDIACEACNLKDKE